MVLPPASISLAVSLHSTRSSSSLSIQPFRYAETSTVFPAKPTVPLSLVGPLCQTYSPKFAAFYHIPDSVIKVKKYNKLLQPCSKSRINMIFSFLKRSLSLSLLSPKRPTLTELSSGILAHSIPPFGELQAAVWQLHFTPACFFSFQLHLVCLWVEPPPSNPVSLIRGNKWLSATRPC